MDMWSVEYTRLSVKTGGSVFSVSLEVKGEDRRSNHLQNCPGQFTERRQRG